MNRVSVSVPDTPAYIPLLRLLLGGVGARGNMSYNAMDDLLLAIEDLLAGRVIAGTRLSMQVEVGERRLEVRLDGLSDASLRAEIAADPEGEDQRPWNRRTLLRQLVDRCWVEEGTPGTFAVCLTKTCP